MCGIAGIVNAGIAPQEIEMALARMQQAMFHRGPDDGGVHLFRDQGAGLCARRLSIVDLENGHQPFANEDETVVAVLNGEIYNHQALRGLLQSHGYRFRGHSDTEAILHLYEFAGVEFLNQIRGMFALAIYDARRRRLVLARDGAGMKPLYIARTRDGFIFASEAKALFASGLIEPEPNLRAVDVYLAAGFVPAELSAFRGIEKLSPGQYITLEDGNESIGRFWQIQFRQPDRTRSEADYAAELETLFTEAVRFHLAADTPVGAFLSGGWDSSLTASLAVQAVGRNLQTFSVVFPDNPDADESTYSRQMARHLGTKHYEVEYRNSLLPELLPKMARHLEEPSCHLPTAPIWLLASLGADHVKSVISGEGSDELFGGYDRFQVNYPYLMRKFVPRGVAGTLADRCDRDVLRRGFRFLSARDERSADAELRRILDPAEKRRLLRAEFCSDGPDMEPLWIAPQLQHSCQDRLQRRLALELTRRLPENILFTTDKMSMAHSLEVRMPFLDQSVMEFAFALPSRLKVSGNRAKVILASLARKYLPLEIAARRKQGLGYPRHSWSRPPVSTYVRELLLESKGPLNTAYLERHLPGSLSGAAPAALPINCLVMLQVWWNEFFANRAEVSCAGVA
ncbi:MAG TPA: asparagine synthase (glutamine-hydrolyzing) [Bryobacteraceae bacterium]|nr:asparagine synthase (glutamine-hydrolyzing) [Bryobacteraceae bacterium]